MRVDWAGVFPAATTQFAPDLSIDIPVTQKVQDALVRDGVPGCDAQSAGNSASVGKHFREALSLFEGADDRCATVALAAHEPGQLR